MNTSETPISVRFSSLPSNVRFPLVRKPSILKGLKLSKMTKISGDYVFWNFDKGFRQIEFKGDEK